ncbi:hypothetical protein ACFQU2_35755 [Siccirubricoccus deserti]
MAAEVQVLKAALGKTATENAPQSGGASAQSAWEAAELRAGEEERRLSLQEAHLLAENLEAANAAFIQTNLELKRRVSELKIELEAARAALRTGEEHLRLIFESATEYAIFTLGLDGRFTSWNPGRSASLASLRIRSSGALQTSSSPRRSRGPGTRNGDVPCRGGGPRRE